MFLHACLLTDVLLLQPNQQESTDEFSLQSSSGEDQRIDGPSDFYDLVDSTPEQQKTTITTLPPTIAPKHGLAPLPKLAPLPQQPLLPQPKVKHTGAHYLLY